MRPLFKELRDVGGYHALKGANQVLPLGQDVGHDCAHEKTGVGNQHGVALQEGFVLELADALIKDFCLGSLQGQVDGTAYQVGDESNSAIDVVAHGLDELAGLRLGHHGVLLVTAVDSEVDVLLGVVQHALSLTLRQLDQVEADLDHDVLHLAHVNVCELLIS